MLGCLETSDECELASLESVEVRALKQIPAFEFELFDRPIRFVDHSFSIVFCPQFSHENTVKFLFEDFVFVFCELFVTLKLANEVFERK